MNPLARQAGAELLGTAGLIAVAVAVDVAGSGVAASRLSPSDTGLQSCRTPWSPEPDRSR